MKGFSLKLLHATGSETIEDVISFVGEDASGSFGILAGHRRIMTSLVIGLARFRTDHDWLYLALPGALLYFNDDVLTISTRRYLVDKDYMRITDDLQQQLRKEEEELRATKESVHRMEEEILKRLWNIGRSGPEV
ncbi:MAG: F0F1 ATP synthase subunit epsilon [Gammaproteobacteria bacterium]|jgi:F-type H+-transporting ATPase subunit epsilon